MLIVQPLSLVAKRQTAVNYVDNDGITTTQRTSASTYLIENTELFLSSFGTFLSVDQNLEPIPFILSGTQSSGNYSTSFSIVDLVLTWSNVQFFFGVAKFCTTVDHQVYAFFLQATPSICVEIVELLVEAGRLTIAVLFTACSDSL